MNNWLADISHEHDFVLEEGTLQCRECGQPDEELDEDSKIQSCIECGGSFRSFEDHRLCSACRREFGMHEEERE